MNFLVKALNGLVPFLGLHNGEPAGLECVDPNKPGTKVSELVAELTATGLGRDPTRVSDEEPDVISGTHKLSGTSVDDSPGTELNLIHVRFFISSKSLMLVNTEPLRSSLSSSISEQSESTSPRLGSDSVSQEAIGASFGLGGGTNNFVTHHESSDCGDTLCAGSESLRSSTKYEFNKIVTPNVKGNICIYVLLAQ